jgi:hypothetical protein
MGFWDKLLWGASRRFANDVTNGATKEQNRQKDIQVRNKISTFNTVSQDYYDKLNFLSDIGELTSWVFNNILEGKDNHETVTRFRTYYDTHIGKVKNRPHLPLTGTALELYQQGLVSLDKTVRDIEWFLMNILLEDIKKRSEQDLITVEEWKALTDEVYDSYQLIVHDRRNLNKIANDIIEKRKVFLQNGEMILEMLK